MHDRRSVKNKKNNNNPNCIYIKTWQQRSNNTKKTKNTNKKNKKENVTVTEVHGMQNLDMKLKLHTTFFFFFFYFFFINIQCVFGDQCVVWLNKSLES